MVLTPAQAEIAADPHRFRVVNCGRRFGKTTLSVEEMIGFAVARPGNDVCYVAPTYQQARDLAWQALKSRSKPVQASVNESRLEIVVRTRGAGESRIILRGWEAIETLRGMKFAFVVIDEVASMRSFWANWQEVIRPTLTDLRGHALFISTPKGFNHFYDLFGLEKKDPDYKSFHFTSYDNPNVPSEEIDKARKELTEDRFFQEYMADFRKMEGLVYKEFDRKRHVYGDRGPSSVRMSYVGVDFGFTNPTAMLKVLEDADANLWVSEEYYRRGKTTAEIVEYAKTLKGNAYYPDPAEPDRIEEMRRAGLNVMDVSKDVAAGIDSVRSLFKTGKLRIHESCANLIAELDTYSYRSRPAGMPSNEPEEPVKENDHALDALRYVVHMRSPAPSDDLPDPEPYVAPSY